MAKKAQKIQIPSARAEDQPATRKMLSLVRQELKTDIRMLEHKMDAGFNTLRAEFRAEIGGLKSEMSALRSDTSRMAILLEEQNANNRIVLDGLQGLWQRQDRIEQEWQQGRSRP